MHHQSLGFALRKKCTGPVGGPRACLRVANGSSLITGPKAAMRARQGYRRFYGDARRLDGNMCAGASQCGTPHSADDRSGSRIGSSYGTDKVGLMERLDDEVVSCAPSAAGSTNSQQRRASQPASMGGAALPTINESRSEPCLRRPSGLDTVLAKLDHERVALDNEIRQGVVKQRQSRRLSSAGSVASGVSSRSSSCWSQAARSTVLDLELQLERERREAAEAELATLKDKLANAS